MDGRRHSPAAAAFFFCLHLHLPCRDVGGESIFFFFFSFFKKSWSAAISIKKEKNAEFCMVVIT
jgi:hypothetical protein